MYKPNSLDKVYTSQLFSRYWISTQQIPEIVAPGVIFLAQDNTPIQAQQKPISINGKISYQLFLL